MSDWRAEMEELSSAEEFLEFFGIAHDPEVVRVHRLHILQRFHDYLAASPENDSCAFHGESLRRAYADFVNSDARREKVFKVFRRQDPRVAVVPISNLMRRRSDENPI